MAVSLKNVSGEVLFYGSRDGKRVDIGEVIEVEGTVAKDSPEDAYLIGDGDDARLYPKATWEAAKASKAKEIS